MEKNNKNLRELDEITYNLKQLQSLCSVIVYHAPNDNNSIVSSYLTTFDFILSNLEKIVEEMEEHCKR